MAGCAPATVQALKDKPAGVTKFEIDRNYQAVYRSIVAQARRCHEGAVLTAQMVVQADLYTDIRSGTVTVQLRAAFGTDTYLTIDINAVDEERTRVESYYAMAGGKAQAAAVEGWARSDAQACLIRGT